MDWLTKIPGIGPYIARLMKTHAYRSYERLDEVKWSRLAAAMTFTSFIALFPLITVAAAVIAGTLGTGKVDDLQHRIKEQVPGIADQLDLQGLVDNAGTVGVVAGALLLFTGINWVGSVRECLRVVWEIPEDEGNPLLRKVKDGRVLLGLGVAGLFSVAASTLSSTAINWAAGQLGIEESGAGRVVLRVAAFAVAVLADFLLLLYVLSLLPGVHPDRRSLVIAGLIGSVGFELLKLLIGGYISGVASKSMYGVFGVPIALLLWINFTAKLLLYCAAWTATRKKRPEDREEREGTQARDGAEEEAEGAAEGETAGNAGEDSGEGSGEDAAVEPGPETPAVTPSGATRATGGRGAGAAGK